MPLITKKIDKKDKKKKKDKKIKPKTDNSIYQNTFRNFTMTMVVPSSIIDNA